MTSVKALVLIIDTSKLFFWVFETTDLISSELFKQRKCSKCIYFYV